MLDVDIKEKKENLVAQKVYIWEEFTHIIKWMFHTVEPIQKSYLDFLNIGHKHGCIILSNIIVHPNIK